MARALGRYELLRPLARGGMAEVYLARRRAAGIEKWLVVKRMRPERTGDPQFLELFVREARLSMSLAHQNIVPVFDFGKIDDQVFLAMERVEGKDLGSSLARAASHRLPPLLAAFIAAECCQALDYAHQRKGPDGVALGIVHRDVTPRNVLLSWSGEVKLTDFGIAALAGDATARLLGTPQYMAPEQARSEPIDPRADIYAIGLVLREALCGRRPRPGVDRDSILDAARRAELIPWSHLTGETTDLPPGDLVAIVDRATAARAADRYPDARSMLYELDAFIVAQRAAHKAESPARQLATWLGAVWEGARDDDDSDAAIHAEHLVSFIDDGALDVMGTGTVRSIAATVAEEVLLGAPPGAAAAAELPPIAAHARPPTGPAPQLSVAGPAPGSPARGADTPRRTARISSSNSTVASGSFLAISDRDTRHSRPLAAQVPGRNGGRIGGASIAVAVVLAAIVIAGRFDRGGRRDSPPSVAPPVAAPAANRPPPAAAASPPTVAATPTGGDRPDPPAPARPRVRPAPGRPAASRAAAPPPPTAPPAQPPGEAAGRASGDPAKRCRVRINLTPWAYFTADDDPTRHETPGTLDLAPGPHRLHVWNPELHVERDIAIHVPADRDTMNYSEPLQPAAPR